MMEIKTEITDMLEDDNIAISNQLKNVCDGDRRRESNSEEKEKNVEQVPKREVHDINNDVDMEIWKGPDASLANIDCPGQNNGLLRVAKVTPSSTYRYRGYLENIYKANRRYPNNTFDCPRGTSTILPFNSQQPRYVDCQRGNRRNINRRFKNFYRGSNHNNNSSGNFTNMNPNINNYQNNIGIGGVRSERIGNQNLSMNNGNGTNNNNLREVQIPGTSQNLIIKVPSNAINLGQVEHLKSCFLVPNADKDKIKVMPVGSLTAQAEAVLNLNKNPNTASKSSNKNLTSWLGFQGKVSADMMPLFATRLMGFLQNGPQPLVHKPIYDMKIQKEIHELQKKPMLCGEVISSDGAGINCNITPRSSGISLNCRFA